MSEKNISRIRRAKKTRMKIREQEAPRLSVYRSSKNFKVLSIASLLLSVTIISHLLGTLWIFVYRPPVDKRVYISASILLLMYGIAAPSFWTKKKKNKKLA